MMKKLIALAFLFFVAACNEDTNKSENSTGTEISTPSVSVDTAGTDNDTTGSGLGADTTRPKTNTADN